MVRNEVFLNRNAPPSSLQTNAIRFDTKDYFSIFSGKINTFFTNIKNNFPDSTAAAQGQRKRQREGVQDPVPDPAEQPAPDPEPHAHPARDPKQREDTQSAPARVERKGQQGRKREQGVEKVRAGRQKPPPPKRAQAVVGQAQRKSRRQSRAELPELKQDRELHQPKNLRSRPPVGAVS